jgi:Uma2 family endonuclease
VSLPYEEKLNGRKLMRAAPGVRHELICGRLYRLLVASVSNHAGFRLNEPRTAIPLSHAHQIAPDLALINTVTGEIFLAVEVVSRDDHRTDTVTKKEIYEEFRVQRLWMVDPRYDNVEIYHASEYGLRLQTILAGREVLSEDRIPEFAIVVAELFAAQPPS